MIPHWWLYFVAGFVIGLLALGVCALLAPLVDRFFDWLNQPA